VYELRHRVGGQRILTCRRVPGLLGLGPPHSHNEDDDCRDEQHSGHLSHANPSSQPAIAGDRWWRNGTSITRKARFSQTGKGPSRRAFRRSHARGLWIRSWRFRPLCTYPAIAQCHTHFGSYSVPDEDVTFPAHCRSLSAAGRKVPLDGEHVEAAAARVASVIHARRSRSR
jgi:hypothetical protein